MADRNRPLFLKAPASSQRGQALLVLLMILVVAGSAVFYSFAGSANSAIERDKITAAALAQAKAALIGYAVAVDLSGAGRPGDLPCPDRDNDGDADAVPACSGAALGRLPWKTLRLPDLRDGDGERLWYAVSSNFKNNPRTNCLLSGMPGYNTGDEAGCLNSDSRGTITIRNSATVINDGTNPDPFTPSGVVAVVFAPGAVLQRQDTGATQDRSCTGGSCTAETICTSSPVTDTPKCNPVNYLDIQTGVEDNANFVDGSNSNGFINGVIRDASNNVIVNDRLITITYQDLMPLLERRVARETLNCLGAYASLNNGRYPWAAKVDDLSYRDEDDERFGRIPDGIPTNPLTETSDTSSGTMSNLWPTAGTECNMIRGAAWKNWKEMVFYGVADAYKPVSGLPPGGPCGNCLRVNPPSSSDDKRVVVIVAGRRLSGQSRSNTNDKKSPGNYVEGDNVDGTPGRFTQQPATSTFNDIVVYQ